MAQAASSPWADLVMKQIQLRRTAWNIFVSGFWLDKAWWMHQNMPPAFAFGKLLHKA